MKIAIFGAAGFLGNKLMEFFSQENEVIGADLKSGNLIEKVDAMNKSEIENFLLKHKPEIIIDTIALTSSVACEKNPELCKKLNYQTAKDIFEISEEINAKMIFISSSYVFDGETGDYSEEDKPKPKNEYAKTKIFAENEILKNPNSIIIRIEPMYGYDEKIKQIKFGTGTFEKDKIEVGYPNIIRNPIFIDDVPKIIFELIKQNQKGIFHIAGPEKIKWIDFLKKLVSLVHSEEKIEIVDSSNWAVKSPKNSSLHISKINSLGIKTTSFEDALKILEKQRK